MYKLLLTTALMLAATPAFAKEYTIKEVTDYDAKKQHFFSPDKLTIQPGDTVTFENVQDEPHEVMFISVPKQVNEMIMSPMHEKKGDTGDTGKIIELSYSVFWLVFPSLAFFLILPFLLKQGLTFPVAMTGAAAAMAGLYGIGIWLYKAMA